MDRNLFLAITLSILVLMLWSSLQDPPQRQQPTDQEGAPATAESPSSAAPPIAPVAPQEAASAPAPQAMPGVEARTFQVETEQYVAELSTLGASLVHWELKNFHEGKRRGRKPVSLTTGGPALVTPLLELGLGDLSQAVFEVESGESGFGNTFAFRYRSNGVTVRKRYEFLDGSYDFRLQLEIVNDSAGAVTPQFGVDWPAREYDAPDFKEQALVSLVDADVEQRLLNGLGTSGFLGSLTGQRAMREEPVEGETDWAGSQTTYFLSAILPDTPAQARSTFVATEPGKAGYSRLAFTPVTIPPGKSVLHEFRGYSGPKEVDRLVALGGETVRSVDLGWSWVRPLTRIFGGLLRAIYQVIPNYGVAIILLTILVRVVTIPLTTKQMRSMERMRALQPKIKELQAKHADDRQVQSQKMMELYRQEKVNPLGGCLPMILQLPVFIGLFYALRSSIDLRQSPFVSWIDDLSAPETLFMIPGVDLPVRVLPLLMGASMFVQQKITPMQMDPAQARMMITIMPIMMTVLFYQFASGLVLYWMVSNVLAISHQTWIGRRMKEGK